MLRIVVERSGSIIWDRSTDSRLVRIGRGDDNDVVLADDQVSSHHLVIKRSVDGAFTAIDQSANGTFLDGKKISTLRIASPVVLVMAGYEVTLIPVEKTDTVESDVPDDQASTVTDDLPRIDGKLTSPQRPGARLRIAREDGTVDTANFVDSAMIGRDEDCDLRIQSREISRRHAFLFRRGGHYLIKRLSRVNPVRVNNRVLQEGESSELEDGDVIDMSGIRIEFLRPENAMGDRPTLVEGRQPNLGFSIEIRQETAEIVRIELLGFLGEKTAPRFESAAGGVIPGARRVIIDLGYLIGIDDSGISSLVRMAADCDRRRVSFRLENVGPRVRDAFHGSSMRKVIDPYIHQEQPLGGGLEKI